MVKHYWMMIIALLFLLPAGGSAAEQQLRPGDPFPELQLASPGTVAERDYLGLTAPGFTPSQVKAEVLLVELLNVHCPHCQMQTPSYNELFKRIEAGPASRGRIKLLGIAVGNLPEEVEKFRQNYRVEFPILADPGFAAWREIGAGSTPFTIYVRQDRAGRAGVVAGLHRGLNTDYQRLYQSLRQMTDEDPAALRRRAQAAAKKWQARQLPPLLSAAEQEYQVRSALTRHGIIMDFTALALPSGRQVYSAWLRSPQGNQRLFAEVTSRGSICDICHDIHFIYLFDRSARVVGFEPLKLTKYGNVDWTPQEVEKMRQRVIGTYLSMPQPFEPKVDAISSATMTSAIIFDSLAQGEELLQELRAQGLM